MDSFYVNISTKVNLFTQTLQNKAQKEPFYHTFYLMYEIVIVDMCLCVLL
jgi:hypothetical protein